MNRHVRIGIVVLTTGAFLVAGWCGSGNTQAQQMGGMLTAASKPAPPASEPASVPATTSAPGVRAVHVFASGKVQGVGFRDWVVVQAKTLKLTGWVRNLTDKRVEAVIEGPADAVAAMLEKMKKGPSTARVDDLKVADETPTGKYKDFDRVSDSAPPS